MIKKTRIYVLSVMLIAAMFTEAMSQNFIYPKTRKTDTVDNYFGTRVPDPYRWLEDDRSAETAAWVTGQNKVTDAYLSQIPFREKYRELITRLWNYPSYGIPFWEGKYYFYFLNSGLQNQSVLYVKEGLNGTPRVLIDPNAMSKDGTTALGSMAVSKGGKYLGFSLVRGGSDWNEIHVIDVKTGKETGDVLEWVKFSGISWYKDGFYYSRYDAPKKGDELTQKNEYHKVYYHKIGTKQSADVLVYEDKEYPLRNFGTQVTEDEKFLFLYESESTSGVALSYLPLGTGEKEFRKIAGGFDYEYGVLDNIDGRFLVVTNYKAPRKKLVMIDPRNPEPEHWQVIIPEREEVLSSTVIAGDRIFVDYMKDACSKVLIYSLNGDEMGELLLPGGIGSLEGFSGRKGCDTAFYSFSSFTFPSTIFRYSVTANKSEKYFSPDIKFDAEEYVAKQVFYTSKDGTRIPMFIVHKKGLVLDGNNPTYLYGYGGFNVSLTPWFSMTRMVFMDNGGVFALPNIRGGGEYGEEWHKAGTKLKKQNVFDDFIAAAEYLIAQKYTSPEKLAISGGSNGGLLVGACMTQRPELFKVALPAVGVLDMLRFHKFTIGWAWTGDYGSSDSPEEFNYLYKYSPLHNIRSDVQYPATLVTTADHDDRVVPAHSFKFIARLQECNAGKNPVLIRIETMAGHGGGKPLSKSIDEATDVWSFVFYNLGMTLK